MYVIHRDCGSVSGFARAGGQRDREKERERGRRDGGGEADCSTLCGVRCFYKQIGSGPSRISRLPSPRDRETLPILFSKPEFPPPSSRMRLPGEEVEKISGTRKIHRYAHRSRGERERLRSVKRVSEMISRETFFLGGCIWNREGENGREGFLFRGSNETGAWIAIRLDLFLSRKDNELLMIRLEEN